jgi:hypothetical protein
MRVLVAGRIEARCPGKARQALVGKRVQFFEAKRGFEGSGRGETRAWGSETGIESRLREGRRGLKRSKRRGIEARQGQWLEARFRGEARRGKSSCGVQWSR